ncbi:MAG: histidine kinase [Bacteroidia bacterium]|nr:histidine kinase [Bacteroidia bacterium]
MRSKLINRKWFLHPFYFFALFAGFRYQAQEQIQPIAKFTFDASSDIDLVNQRKVKMHGYSYCEDRFGNPKHAIYLFGNEYSYLNLGNYKELKPLEGSISLWVKIQVPVATGYGFEANPILLTKNSNNNDFFEAYGIYLDLKNNMINASSAKDSLEQVRLFCKSPLSFSDWHHLVLVYNNNFMTLYFDGELQSRIVKPFSTYFQETDSVLVGVSANKKNKRYMEGAVDDIQFFDVALNDKQVDALYRAPNPNRFRLYLDWALRALAIVVFIAFLVWLITKRYRTQLKKERERDQLNAHLNALETKAIRTQMNPHFMFNSLNTLQRFILEKDFDNAHVYLTKFSRLLRKMLESSTAELISLSEEINLLDHYIELENLRSDNSFEYKIINTVPGAENTFIPIMLIQPFVENAIWHGIMAKKENRKLSITFKELDAQRIQCIVDDNGVGREESLKHKDPFKKKSLATEFIKQRLELIQKSGGIPCSFEIIDKKDQDLKSLGTTVVITLPKNNPL